MGWMVESGKENLFLDAIFDKRKDAEIARFHAIKGALISDCEEDALRYIDTSIIEITEEQMDAMVKEMKEDETI